MIGHSAPEGDSSHFAEGGQPSGLHTKCIGQTHQLWHFGIWAVVSTQSNDGLCQLLASPGQWHVFTAKHPQLLLPLFLMAVVCQYIRDKDRGGEYHTPAAWLGCRIWLLACPLLSSWDGGVGDATDCLCSSFEVPRGPNCSSSSQKCTLADRSTDVPSRRSVVSSGTSLPLWWPYDCRCRQKSRLGAQDETDINHTSSQLTPIQGEQNPHPVITAKERAATWHWDAEMRPEILQHSKSEVTNLVMSTVLQEVALCRQERVPSFLFYPGASARSELLEKMFLMK